MGKLIGFLTGVWTLVSAWLALTDTVNIPTWLVVGPQVLVYSLMLVALLILGIVKYVADQ